jgi:hypothetical protein
MMPPGLSIQAFWGRCMSTSDFTAPRRAARLSAALLLALGAATLTPSAQAAAGKAKPAETENVQRTAPPPVGAPAAPAAPVVQPPSPPPSVVATAGPPPVLDPLQIFQRCDGYGAPNKAGDGMTKQALSGWIFVPGVGYGDTTRKDTRLGRSTVPYCDAALADPRLTSNYWMRKVSLLRARAMHRLAAGDDQGAIVDLDLAEAAAADPTDPYYRRSLKFGIDLIRAYALRGESGRTEALGAAAAAARPFSRSALASVWTTIGPDADQTLLDGLLRDLARLSPALTGTVFDEAFEHGRFEEAIALYPSLIAPVDLGDEPLYAFQRIFLAQKNRKTAALFHAQAAGEYAYALAATGKSAEARAVLAKAQADLDREGQVPPPPPPPPPGKKAKPDLTYSATLEAAGDIRREGPGVLAPWVTLTNQRIRVAEGQTGGVDRELAGKKLEPTYASIDLIQALAAAKSGGGGLAGAVDPEVVGLKKKLAALRREPRQKELSELFESLPETESLDRAPVFGARNVGIFRPFQIETDPATGVTTVKCWDFNAPGGMVEEMVLLKVADMALAAGKPGFLIVGRGDWRHTMVMVSYGVKGPPQPQGYETRLQVLFVDPAALPPGYEASAWRVMDAAKVKADLLPLYAPKPKSKAR